MKTVFIFIGLKLVELCLAGLVFTGLSWIVKKVCDQGNYWKNGLVAIVVIMTSLVVVLASYLVLSDIITINWNWAKQLSN